MGPPRVSRKVRPTSTSERSRFSRGSTVPTPWSIKKAVKGETIQRVASPTAMLVGLSDTLAHRCTAVLGGTGLRVLRVGHVAAAGERLPVVMPQLVIVPHDMVASELEMLTDRCVAVGAHLLTLAPDATTASLSAELRQAASAALLRAMQG